MDEQKLLLRCGEAARRLSMGRSKIYMLAASGELPSVRIGRSVRIPVAALEHWISEKTAAGTPEGGERETRMERGS